MDGQMTGSALTRAMLRRGDHMIWCAVDDTSDAQAMRDHTNNNFTTHIVSYRNGQFTCIDGITWLFAVPIKIIEVTKEEVRL
ncbi:hypothetical protein [uncultured Psychrobacter sp.]|uniref:hypothetical protein n=1 Tax=unclassified Psychrobacter TaxID=196806 RepID=UPI00293D223F|nr:hypothetical protein [uncultured Psychrobacter sp.]